MNESEEMELISRAARRAGWAAGTIAALVVLALRHELDHFAIAPAWERRAITIIFLAGGAVAAFLAIT